MRLIVVSPSLSFDEPNSRQSPVEIVAQIGHVLATAVFVFMMIIPSEALAYTQQLSNSQSLVFITDETLIEEALLSENFSMADPAHKLTRLRASAIQTIDASQLYEGASIRVLAFAYSSDVNQTDADPFTTAAGNRAEAGTIAANWLPFNTQVRIGDSLYTIQDRMNERYNDRYVIDIWQPTAAEAVHWGARVVDLEIVSIP